MIDFHLVMKAAKPPKFAPLLVKGIQQIKDHLMNYEIKILFLKTNKH